MAQLKVIVSKLNRRQAPINDFTDKTNVKGTVAKGYLFVSESVIENKLGKWYADRDGYYYWGGGVTLISADYTLSVNALNAVLPSGKAKIPLPKNAPKELPLSRTKCKLTADWMSDHFGDKCQAIVEGTPFTKELLYAIACKETAIYFYDWTKDHTPDEVLARCVFDASGDVYGKRKVFPKNTPDFIGRYGHEIADELIAEANKMRAMRGFGPKQWVYAGYGIFQYDIQHITHDEAFFTQKKWYNIDDCLKKVIEELNKKWKAHPNDLFETVRSYNGSGDNAVNYANSVFQFLAWINNRT